MHHLVRKYILNIFICAFSNPEPNSLYTLHDSYKFPFWVVVLDARNFRSFKYGHRHCVVIYRHVSANHSCAVTFGPSVWVS